MTQTSGTRRHAIRTPRNFYHAGNLTARFASVDPRPGYFPYHFVDIDMRQTEFVWPAAVLWCAVYAYLSRLRGAECRLLVPENVGVCSHLKTVGLFSILQTAGVDVDDRDIRESDNTQVVLPLSVFHSENQAEQLANDALATLAERGLSSPNLNPVVAEIFGELAMNAVQHAESEVGGFGLIQFFQFEHGNRFVCIVADGGIGIRRSLERNPELRDRVPYDWVAIELATRERITGTGEPTRGIGLFGVAEDLRSEGRQLIIHSGIGSLNTTEEIETESKRTTLFPGTLAYASIPA